MNFKDLLLPLAFALLSTWAIQYFFFPKQVDNRAEVATDRSFVAPTSVISQSLLILRSIFLMHRLRGQNRSLKYSFLMEP